MASVTPIITVFVEVIKFSQVIMCRERYNITKQTKCSKRNKLLVSLFYLQIISYKQYYFKPKLTSKNNDCSFNKMFAGIYKNGRMHKSYMS